MSGATQPRTIGTPSNHRGYTNNSGTQIPKYRIVKRDGTTDGCALADSATAGLIGVTDEAIDDKRTGDVFVRGKSAVLSGAAIAVGEKLTSDSTGRAVPLTFSASSPQVCIGTANTAAGGADELIECDHDDAASVLVSVMDVATRAALKAVPAADRFDGQVVLVVTDGSLWFFDADRVGTEDRAQELLLTPDAGTGRWVRQDQAFMMRIPVDFSLADVALIETIPAGMTVRITGFPFYEIDTAFTGGSSSAIGADTSLTGYDTAGDLIGGATGDVLAGLTAGIRPGTIGGELDLTGFHEMLLVAGSSVRWNKITSSFTAGAGFICIPVAYTLNTP